MIVTMKKISLVIMENTRKKSLDSLRRAGVLHIEQMPAGSGETLNSLLEARSRIDAALAALDSTVKTVDSDTAMSRDEVFKKVDEILDIEQTIKDIHSGKMEIAVQLQKLEPFGDFEPADLAILQNKGIDIKLFEGDSKTGERLKEAGSTVFVVGRNKKTFVYASVVCGGLKHELGESPVELPEYGRKELLRISTELDERLSTLTRRLVSLSEQRAVFEQTARSLNQDIEYEKLASGMDTEGVLCWVTGYVPEDSLAPVSALAADNGWAMLVRDPDPGDPIPTLIKNNPGVRIIQPVFDFLGTLPGYREYDISLYFLAYFSIFFAMIIGDAGYGVIFLLTAIGLTISSRRKGALLPDAVKLLYVLSLATVVWGTITGNWFGTRALASLPLLKSLTIPAISTYPDLFPGVEVEPQKKIMWLCFLLGLTQLTLANLLNFIRNFPKLKAFANLGWGLIVGGLYFLVLTLVISSPMPQFAIIMVAVGFGMVIVFGEQEKGLNFFKGMAKGLGGAFTTFLDAISGFSNIISYIRLFAVGMSSFYIASSFNNLASPMLEGWTFPFGILVIAIGHGLNLIMAILSVVVHGIRLNMLEFSGQLGMEWTGIEYNPFRVRISQENNKQGVPS